MAASVKDITTELARGPLQPDISCNMPTSEASHFADVMFHELLDEPIKTTKQKALDRDFVDKLVDEFRITPLES